MTFNEISQEILDRLDLTSTDDTTRIGRAINRVYRTVTSALGIKHVSRRTTVQATTTMGVSTLTFTGAEKLINVFNRNVTPYKQLEEVTVDELRAEQPFADGDEPSRYAVETITADTVTVLLNCVPQTAFALYADVYASTATLSGTDEPAFSESYHDILIHGVLVDEYLKVEKPSLSAMSEKRYDKRMGELQLWIAVSTTKKIHQGKTAQLASSGAGGSGGGSFNGAQSWTQTGLITFDRDPSAPFAVTASSAVVPNLDADMVDGLHAASFAKLNLANAGSLLFVDATHDIGASGATRPRDLFLSRNAVIGGTLGVTGATTLAALSATTGTFSSTLGVTGAATFDGAVTLGNAAADAITVTGTLASNLIFTDATYDIGASGATRPRDLFLSRNAVIGGTLNVTGATTLTSLVADSASVDIGGASSGSATVGGRVASDDTQASTGANTSETVLYTYQIPANALNSNGRGIRIRAMGTTAANANNKTLRIRLGGIGGTIIATSYTAAINNATWMLEAVVLRIGSNTQRGIGQCLYGPNTGTALASSVLITAPTQTDTAAIDLVVTGQNGTSSSGDCVYEASTVEFLN